MISWKTSERLAFLLKHQYYDDLWFIKSSLASSAITLSKKTTACILTTCFAGNSANLFCNVFSSWKLKIISSRLPRWIIKVHLKQWLCLLGCTSIPKDVAILVDSGSCCAFYICHCKTGHCFPFVFVQNICLKET